MSVSFDAYRIFYYVGKYRNITHAATALFLSQSTVSRCIQNLESELDCKLFERSQQGVRFTTEGELLYGHVSQAVEYIQSGEDKVRQMKLMEGGGVRIGVSDFTFQQYVLPVLKPFHANYPTVQLEVFTFNFNADFSMMETITSGAVDFACVCAPVPKNDDVEVEDIAVFDDALIAGNEFSELKGRRFELADLIRKYPVASLTNGAANGADGIDFLVHALADEGLSVRPAYQVNSVSQFIPMVEEGLCLAVVPVPLLEKAGRQETDNIFQVELETTLPKRRVCIVRAKNARKSRASEQLIRDLKASIRQPEKPYELD